MRWLVCLVGAVVAVKAFLAIAILSKDSNFEQRQAIRQSWLSNKPENVKVAFVLGYSHSNHERIEEEAREHKDILVIKGHPESYRGIVEKTKVAFKWAFGGEEPSKFLLKCDDDSYVHLSALLKQLVEYFQADPLHPHYYMGDFRANTKVIRDPHNKYFVSHPNWQDTQYPLFAVGCGYVIGSEVGRHLLNTKLMDFSVPIEDVTVGIWMDQLVNLSNYTVKYKVDLRFVPTKSMGWHKTDFVWHELGPAEMRNIWEEYRNKI